MSIHKSTYIILFLILSLFWGGCEFENIFISESCPHRYKYDEVDKPARYKHGGREVIANNVIIPELRRLRNEYGSEITSLELWVTISIQGEVTAIRFETKMPREYSDALGDKIDKLTGWVPAKKDGKKVCSEWPLKIPEIEY